MEQNHLSHHGIKGQRWGVRRFQNPDGTLTSAGKKHYREGYEADSSVKKSSSSSVKKNPKVLRSDAMKLYTELSDLSKEHLRDNTKIGTKFDRTFRKNRYKDEMTNKYISKIDKLESEIASKTMEYIKSVPQKEAAKCFAYNHTHDNYMIRTKFLDPKSNLNYDHVSLTDVATGHNPELDEILKYARDENKKSFSHNDDNNEGVLSHHGIKGQRWGIRRFQFKDGKLTIAGRKRYAEDGTEIKENSNNKKSGKSKKKGSAPNEPTQKKDVKKMSDQEIRDAISRAKLENEYKQYFGSPEQEHKVSAGRQFVNQAAKKILLEPAIDAAAKGVRTSLDKAVTNSLTKKEESVRKLAKRDISELSPEQLRKVVDYKDLVKRYNDHDKQESAQEKRSKQMDYEMKEINLQTRKMAMETAQANLYAAKTAAEKAARDLNKDRSAEETTEAVRRGQEAVRKLLDPPLALPKPKDKNK